MVQPQSPTNNSNSEVPHSIGWQASLQSDGGMHIYNHGELITVLQ